MVTANPENSIPRESPTESQSDPPPSQSAPDSSRAIEQDENTPSSESTSSEALQPKRRSSIRPAPADWQPPSQRRPFAPMVVVYSGDSERPPPEFDSRAPSERATQIDIELTAPPQPFPLAEDLSAPSGEPKEAETAPALSTDPKGTHSLLRVWPFVVLGALALITWFVASPSSGLAPGKEPPTTAQVAEHQRRSSPRVDDSDLPKPALATQRRESTVTPEPLARAATTERASAAGDGALAQWVTLEVFPDDTKVFRRGLRVAGPPYSFKIPKGRRVAVELARSGFVTRRVVLDGSEPNVVIGLFRKNPNSPAERSRSSKTSSTLDAHSTVQSGL